MIRELIKQCLAHFDIIVRRRSLSPSVTLLGLRQLPIRTILDVGANLGQYASFLSGHFPTARLYCFEPLPKIFERLRAESKGRWEAFQYALGETVGAVEFHEHLDHSSSSSFLPTTSLTREFFPATQRERSTTVHCTTLDRSVSELSISIVSELLIKLDVQGFEDRVIRGGVETFRKARVCIVEVNLDGLYTGQAEFAELVAQLYSLGLVYSGTLHQGYAPDGHAIAADVVFLRRNS